MDFSDTDYIANEPRIGRLVKNAFGQEETVALRESLWKHFDWMRDNGVNIDEWLKKIDLERHSHKGFIISFEAYIEMGLVNDEKRRFLAGEDIPLSINPDGYLPDEKKPFHKQEVKLEVPDDDGEIVTVHLPRGCWQHLEWLEKFGIDAGQYIIDANILRGQGRWKSHTLRGVLQVLLREDEKARYFSDEPSPLFIRPEGYGDKED